jgi:hypothetical protein
MAALTFIGHKLASDPLAPRQLLYSPLELCTLHNSILGQICPNVKRKMSVARRPADPLPDPQIVNPFQRCATSPADERVAIAADQRIRHGLGTRRTVKLDGGLNWFGHGLVISV